MAQGAGHGAHRRFTPKEASGIQSFPDSFVFPVSEIQAYKQIGNAVPVNLAFALGKSIIKLLNNLI